jgi:hypothetical protein
MIQQKCHAVVFFVLLMVSMLTASVQAADVNDIRPVNGRMCSAGELLVKFRDGVSVQSADAVHRDLKAAEWKQGYNNSYQLVSFAPGRESKMVEAYKKRPEVAYAEPNYYATACSLPNDE